MSATKVAGPPNPNHENPSFPQRGLRRCCPHHHRHRADRRPALHQLSIERLQQINTKEAVGFAEQAVKADPTKAEYFSQLGMALGQRMGEIGFMQQAMMSGKLRKAFEKSVEHDPNHVAGLIGLARYYTNAPEIAGGSFVKAAAYATRVRQLNPLLGELELANIANKDEKYAEALAHYEAAATLKPDQAGVQLGCGRMLAKLGRKDEARARIETALKLNRTSRPRKGPRRTRPAGGLSGWAAVSTPPPVVDGDIDDHLAPILLPFFSWIFVPFCGQQKSP
jgi:Flp pilus assembly protein TadD